MNVVGPAVDKNDCWAIGGAGFGVSDIQEACVNLFERAKRCVCARLIWPQVCWIYCAGLCLRETGSDKPGGGSGHGDGAQKVTTTTIECLGHFVPIHFRISFVRF